MDVTMTTWREENVFRGWGGGGGGMRHSYE